ncbi:MAG TPA: hypothetical protein VFM08_03255 [Nocardioides sp.]|nr:hypothetical protein [Nocardioides sp.]
MLRHDQPEAVEPQVEGVAQLRGVHDAMDRRDQQPGVEPGT